MASSYTCKRCLQPLILDPSLQAITQAQTDAVLDASRSSSQPVVDLTSPDLSHVPASQESKDAYLQAKQHDPFPFQKPRSGPAESFIMLSQSQLGHPTLDSDAVPPSSSISTVDYLLSQLSSTTGIDHPVCTGCAAVLQGILQDKLEHVQQERDAYIAFERDWQAKKESKKIYDREQIAKGLPVETESERLEKMLKEKAELELEETELMNELRRVEQEESELDLELKQLKAEDEQLEAQEIRFLEERLLLQAEAEKLESYLETETTLHLLATQTLRRLQNTNVYNDVFQIGHVPLGEVPQGEHWSSTVPSGASQTVGTINGLRLGGRPWVDWVEINAALGLVALCLHRVAEKVGLSFAVYKIVPMGSFSRIEELAPSKNVYELYASTDLSAARLLQNRRFNYALTGMLDCLRQLIAHGKATKKGWATGGLEITKDKIAGHPIKLSANMGMSSLGIVGAVPGSSVVQSTDAEESWTKALRAVLAVLKRILIIESERDASTLK